MYVYRLMKEDVPRAAAVLTDAFQHDPVWVKLFEGQTRYREKSQAFFEIPVRHALRYGEVVATSKDVEGVAAWVPGRYADMTMWQLLRCGALRQGMVMGPHFVKKMRQVFQQLPIDMKAHMQGKTFVYLEIIGVAPESQGRGMGGRLLRTLIDSCDAEGTHIYLETKTEENVSMYEKFGFRVLKKIKLPILELPLWEMAREPHRS
jgi:ribosomal protein S18 acetylase RimI-like enzyme